MELEFQADESIQRSQAPSPHVWSTRAFRRHTSADLVMRCLSLRCGAVLAHQMQRPISFASRTLTKSERKYSQLKCWRLFLA